MAHSWSVTGGKATLTLDGTESGAISRSRVLNFPGHPSEQVTFYLDVNPSDVAVEPFVEVEGGDRVVLTATGPQTVTVRGETDASANVTLRFGVQQAGQAPGAFFFQDDLDYPDIAAFESAGWTANTSGGGGLSVDTSDLDGNSTGVLKATCGEGAEAYISRVFTTVPGRTYTARCRGKNWGDSGFDTGSRIDWEPGPDDSVKVAAWTDLETPQLASGTSLELRIGRFGGFFGLGGSYSGFFHGLVVDDGQGGGSATVEFDNLTMCFGSGVGDGGTGLGGDGGSGTGDDDGEPGTDPVPDPGDFPPPSITGARTLGMHNIPVDGLVYFNSTVFAMTATNAKNNIAKATAAGTKPLPLFGPERDWKDPDGTVVFSRFAAVVDGIVDAAGDEIATAIAGGVLPFCYLLDEPNRMDERYGFKGVSLALVERMALHVKGYFPTWPIIVRVNITNKWVTRPINGVDVFWAEYHLKKGDVIAYRDSNIAGCEAMAASTGRPIKTFMGIHYNSFDGVALGSSDPRTRLITPDEMRHYGGNVMAASDPSIVVGFGGWRYTDRLIAQAGWWPAAKYYREQIARYE